MAEDQDDEKLPEVPPAPELPEAPRLQPKLPKRPMADTPDAQNYRAMGIAYTIPTALIAPIVGLTILGVWLDGKLGCTPACSIGGLLLGIVCGTMNMVRLFRRLQ